MTANGILQIALFFLVVLALAKPMGGYMAKVFAGERTWLHPVLRPLEKAIYRLCGIDETHEQRWTGYAGGVLVFSLVSLLLTYLIMRVQQWLPWNPQGLANVEQFLSFNTAASFTTNTNWQAYTPETTMSYFTEMMALATHNFFSAAVGIAVAIAFVRGFSRHSVKTLGNFWVDFTRCDLLRAAADLDRLRAGALLPGSDSEPLRLHQSHHARRRRANHPARSHRLAGSHQDAGHQRRRIPQRQLGPPLTRTPPRSATSSKCSRSS